MNWQEIVRLQPALDRLLKEVKAVKDDKTKPAFCANAWWYGYGSRAGLGFKERLVCMVGFHSREPRLRTMEAYDLA